METPTFSPRQQAILASLARGTSRTAACHSARVGRRTLYNWIKADPTFAQAVEEAESGAIAQAEDLAYACAMKAADDPRYLRALFFWLKHRAGWTQARADRPPLPPQSHAAHAAQITHVVGAQRAAPSTLDPDSPPHIVPSLSPGTPPIDTSDLASVMQLVRDHQRFEREYEEFMRGYEIWKALPQEERETITDEELDRLISGYAHTAPSAGNPDLVTDGEALTPEENPGIGVPFVPSGDEADEQKATCRDTPPGCPPPEPVSRENPVIGVPSVPSRKRDRMRRPPFKKKKRR